MAKVWICVSLLVVGALCLCGAAPAATVQNDIINVLAGVISSALQPSVKQIGETTTLSSMGLLDPALLKPILDVISKNPKYMTALISDPVALNKALDVILKPANSNSMMEFMSYMLSEYGLPQFK